MDLWVILFYTITWNTGRIWPRTRKSELCLGKYILKSKYKNEKIKNLNRNIKNKKISRKHKK